ncbi:MAG: acetoacetate--CoA ligase [Candidatus Nitronauta litoralis]|uniref:Acetoacetate--CoA ligase n=1 Tax=Candidatus Nitronauta litoralis TaxID=2705533 RepID=A0A7T0BVA4_9BACT|nr:MAG: acetoacetate--CoA ligase [Candidatus Nitronauta litoralis]
MNETLWQPDKRQIRNSQMFRFMEAVNREFNLSLDSYEDLYAWSVEHLQDFWNFYLRYSQIILHSPPDQILSSTNMPGAQWFTGATLNFAENLLSGPRNKTAVISKVEGQPLTNLTYGDLSDQVVNCALSLRQAGVKCGDRVAGYLPNIPETLIAMLATAALGAVWSSCSPDFGSQGVIDRFGQIRPKVLFATDGYLYNGKPIGRLEVLKTLLKEIPVLEHLVVIPFLNPNIDPSLLSIPRACEWGDFLETGGESSFQFVPVDFNHPLFVMYSSGTTGLPKSIVHGTGGTLLQHHKEHALHTDIGPEDVVFYFTTCGWMMWNWLVSVLAQGSTIVLYEGSPAYPSLQALWKFIDEAGITVFGTSAKFLSINEKQAFIPEKVANLQTLRTILSTGSPLSEQSYYWVYQNVKSDVHLASICGGTDIISCFFLGNPMLPVRAGEIQCRGLGMDVVALDQDHLPGFNQKGELACRQPAPSMPVAFWNDPGNLNYRNAYFSQVRGVWLHGDFIEINNDGGIVVFGRSDATLNPGGVRIGTAEIYRVVEHLDGVLDSIAIGFEEENDVQIFLFVVLDKGEVLSKSFKDKIRQALRREASPRHVPHKIFAVHDVPRTLNGKKVELGLRDLFRGRHPENLASLENPQCLAEYEELITLGIIANKETG